MRCGSALSAVPGCVLVRGVAAAKFFVAALTGSSAMFAEGVHSLVDMGNELLLLHGGRRGRRAVDEEHAFGYGKTTYVWSLLVALSVFSIGGGVSTYEGIVRLTTTPLLTDPTWNYVVLAAMIGIVIAALGVFFSHAFKSLYLDPAVKNVGHPGLPLGAAPMAYVLWTRFLKHHPANPLWPDRDHFVLSAGHGSALGVADVKKTKEKLGWPIEPPFFVPETALAHFRETLTQGAKTEVDWKQHVDAYGHVFPKLWRELQQRMQGELPSGWDAEIPVFPAGGGWSYAGRNLHFGVREHAMGAIVNGLSAHGGFIPYGATFLIFSDYMRPPIEQLANLRAIPKLTLIRPGDANETAVAWKVAIEARDRPVLLALTRQDLATLDRSRYASADGLRRGAYVLSEAKGATVELILIASGSEVGLILAAADRLQAEGVAVRRVSMPSWGLFDAQPQSYRDHVLPPKVTARLAVELGVKQGWHRYVGDRGDMLGVDHFGASAPADMLVEKYGFTVDNVVARAKTLLAI